MQFEFKIDGEPCTVVVTDYTFVDDDLFECDYKVYDQDMEEIPLSALNDFDQDWIIDEIFDLASEESFYKSKQDKAEADWERSHAQY